jgi:hypothetical protein
VRHLARIGRCQPPAPVPDGDYILCILGSPTALAPWRMAGGVRREGTDRCPLTSCRSFWGQMATKTAHRLRASLQSGHDPFPAQLCLMPWRCLLHMISWCVLLAARHTQEGEHGYDIDRTSVHADARLRGSSVRTSGGTRSRGLGHAVSRICSRRSLWLARPHAPTAETLDQVAGSVDTAPGLHPRGCSRHRGRVAHRSTMGRAGPPPRPRAIGAHSCGGTGAVPRSRWATRTPVVPLAARSASCGHRRTRAVWWGSSVVAKPPLAALPAVPTACFACRSWRHTPRRSGGRPQRAAGYFLRHGVCGHAATATTSCEFSCLRIHRPVAP